MRCQALALALKDTRSLKETSVTTLERIQRVVFAWVRVRRGAETENTITDSSSGVVVAVSFLAPSTLLLVLYLLMGGCAKKVDDNVESHGLLLANQNRSLRSAAEVAKQRRWRCR